MMETPGVDVYLSGGLRSRNGDGYDYDTAALYRPFNIDDSRMLTVDQIAERRFDVVFSSCTSLIAPGEYGKAIQIFHGISFRNRAIRKKNANYDYYFMIGPYMRSRFAEAQILPEGDPRALNIGFMKTDLLLDDSQSQVEMKQALGFAGDRPVLLFAPTGQKHNSLESMGDTIIQRICETGDYDLLIKLHDHPKAGLTNWAEELQPFENEHCRITQELDVVKCMFAADMLITDASSVSSEYSLVDKPMVFLDVPKLIFKATERDGSMLDLNTWGRRGGDIVKSPEELVPTIRHSLQHPQDHSEIRQDMARGLFYNPGQASQVAFEWFKNTFMVRSGNGNSKE